MYVHLDLNVLNVEFNDHQKALLSRKSKVDPIIKVREFEYKNFLIKVRLEFVDYFTEAKVSFNCMKILPHGFHFVNIFFYTIYTETS